jgi:hypothetical protein
MKPFFVKFDGFVKSPAFALRGIPRNCGVQLVRLVPRKLLALNLKLFTFSSNFYGNELIRFKRDVKTEKGGQ